MHISKFQTLNYKSFKDSGILCLEPGFNVLVGQNNVGKTALIEALSLWFDDRPHHSRETIPYVGAQHISSSRVEVTFEFEETEVIEVLAANGLTTVHVPWQFKGGQQEDAARNFEQSIHGGASVNAVFESGTLTHTSIVGYSQGNPSGEHYLKFDLNPSLEGLEHIPGNFVGEQLKETAFATQMARIFAKNVYNFRAVRFNIEDHHVAEESELAPDARNLVQVLHRLQASNPSMWERYLNQVRTVIPQIKTITFLPTGTNGRMRAFLWNLEPDTERADLAVPLAESGTGIGQVLAVLYVVFTSNSSRTIIIDEPQSFLHPGAVRKLLSILQQFPQHQYVITTHSPTAVTVSDPQALFLVRKQEEASTIEQLDISESQQQSLFLKEVGARLSDVFGSDNILWVEGPTEEECFPLLLSQLTGHQLLGTKILALLSTGDFESKHSRTVFEIYERLSSGGGLLPPAIGFIFDLEQRDRKAREDLKRQSGVKVTFITRRMYENYLLHESAIASVILNSEEHPRELEAVTSEINEWFAGNGWNQKYFGKVVEESTRTREIWVEKVHGAKLLKDLFEEVTEARVTYDKLIHGKALTQWLLNNKPEELKELAYLIKNQIDTAEQTS